MALQELVATESFREPRFSVALREQPQPRRPAIGVDPCFLADRRRRAERGASTAACLSADATGAGSGKNDSASGLLEHPITVIEISRASNCPRYMVCLVSIAYNMGFLSDPFRYLFIRSPGLFDAFVPPNAQNEVFYGSRSRLSDKANLKIYTIDP